MTLTLLRSTVILSVLLLEIQAMNAQSEGAGQLEPRTFSRTITVEQKLDYLIYLPTDYDQNSPEGWPLILFLHGAGERGSDLSRVKYHGPPKLIGKGTNYPAIVVAPQCPEGETWDTATLIGLLDAIVAANNVNTNRVYLTGLSMGGYGTWSLGTEHPERFAAIAPICGGGQPLPIYLADDKRKRDLQNLPVWAFHGAKDPVVPLEESKRMVDALKRIGAEEVKLTVYPEAQHDSWTETYENPLLLQWFLQRQRTP
jgi:predicted peptidase